MFKRNMFYAVKYALQNRNVVFLLGPRKCGKTIALMQLSRELPNSKLYDFKSLSDDESMDIVNDILLSIKNNEDVVYLLDEVTYMYFVDVELAKIARLFTEQRINDHEIKTKIVLTGSQSVALESWGRLSFCNEASFIKSNFLSYQEWLKWKNRTDITKQSYFDFIKGTFEFYTDFLTLEDYLKGCLDETVISNAKSRNYIYGNDCDLVNVESLVNILYSTLLKLHDRVSIGSTFKSGVFTDKMKYIAKQLGLDKEQTTELYKKISSSVIYKYDHVRSLDLETLKQCYAFLIRSDLIVATPVFSDLDKSLNVLQQLESQNSVFKTKSDMFKMLNFTIKYPMFYIEILKELFGDNLSIDGYTLGSVVECHVRGLLPVTGAFEYHDEFDREIDYLSIPNRLAIEITTFNKKIKNVHLDLLDSTYKKILLSDDVRDKIGEVSRVPYYEFIYNLDNAYLSNVCKGNECAQRSNIF